MAETRRRGPAGRRQIQGGPQCWAGEPKTPRTTAPGRPVPGTAHQSTQDTFLLSTTGSIQQPTKVTKGCGPGAATPALYEAPPSIQPRPLHKTKWILQKNAHRGLPQVADFKTCLFILENSKTHRSMDVTSDHTTQEWPSSIGASGRCLRALETPVRTGRAYTQAFPCAVSIPYFEPN